MSLPRFSLRNLLLFVGLATICIALIVSQLRLRDAKSTIRAFEKRFGILNINNPDDFHVDLAAGEIGPGLGFEWHVHLPEGRRFYVRAAYGRISPDGLAIQQERAKIICEMEVKPGTARNGQFVYFSVSKLDASWQVDLRTEGASQQRSYAYDSLAWLDDFTPSGYSARLAGIDGPERFSSREPLVLLVHRRANLSTPEPEGDDATSEGIVVWIEEFFGVDNKRNTAVDEPLLPVTHE